MAKKKEGIVYFCNSCGYEATKWAGQCPACHEWNTFVEERVSKEKITLQKMDNKSEVHKLSEIKSDENTRINTKIAELDRVLGGGIVKGSLVLVGGDPGIGKSTLLFQMCRNIAESRTKVLYVSGEESLQQIKMRAERIGDFSESMLLLCRIPHSAPRP